jgi:hypothetical protein
MSSNPFLPVDQARVEQFHLLGCRHRLLSDFEVYTSEDGIAWAVSRASDHAFGVTWLGPGWVFDPYAAQQRANDLATTTEKVRLAPEDQHIRELAEAIRLIRLGPHSERLLWLIHEQLLASRSSLIKLSDIDIGTTLWGRSREDWPSHWRKDVADILEGLTWLHLTENSDDGLAALGRNTALLTHTSDLRGTKSDTCDEHCPSQGGPSHHHHLVNVGRGFLGVLEQFGKADDESGIRTYQFRVSGPRNAGPTLRRVGKSGRLMSIFVPAKLGAREVCDTFTPSQHRLLQAIVRETGRKKEKRSEASEPEVFTGNTLPGPGGKGTLTCDSLDPNGKFVGFNGNKKLKGLGYCLATPGGWLAKAGYQHGEISNFLDDLAELARPLKLTVVGIMPGTGECLSLERMRAMTQSQDKRPQLLRLCVRIFTTADFIERWKAVFEWPGIVPRMASNSDDKLLTLLEEIDRKQLSRSALAEGIGVDLSFLGKALNGKKRFPDKKFEAARAWVTGFQRSRPPLAAPWPAVAVQIPESGSLLGVALAYREEGWCILPQLPGAKKPKVRWKPFQEQLPTVKELEYWFARWPDAGLALILGPISNLLVIDVDGPEAHAALLEHLGQEPLAPKALSGSRKPHRYHLYFRHPDLRTRAKKTPWHKKLEFRGKGGIVIAPPSMHKSGHRYEWAPGQSPADLPFPDVPPQVLAALQPPARPVARPSPVNVDVPVSIVCSPLTRQFLGGAFAEGPRWNDHLYWAACDLAGRNIVIEVAEPLLLAGAKPWNATEEQTAKATIQSAFSQSRVPGFC